MRCKQKRRFGGKVSALLEMNRLQDKKGHLREKAPMRVYRCPECKGWHLTSKKRGGVG